MFEVDESDVVYLSHEEKLKQYEESIDEEFLKFENIPKSERLNSDELICGLLKLQHIDPNFDVEGGHEIIYVMVDMEKVSEKDVLYLTRCGFRLNLDGPHFQKFL